MNCPFYLGGRCYNPAVVSAYGKPSGAVVKQEQCVSGNYKECSFFADPPDQEASKEVYPIIHKVPCTTYSECPNFTVKRVGEEDCVAYCRAVEKYVPRNSVTRCIEVWKTCPFLSTSR